MFTDLRASGILLHPTSLPGRHGVGQLGAEARRFADFLGASGQKVWQVLPLGPTGFGDSPYQCLSTFAGNPLLVDLDTLLAGGLLEKSPVSPVQEREDRVDYGRIIPLIDALLAQAAARFQRMAAADERVRFEDFCRRESVWLDDFALFVALKKAHGGAAWHQWERGLANRESAALAHARRDLAVDIDTARFTQYQFFVQWQALREYCHERGIRLMGDLPIFVAGDSADVWAHRELFQVDEDGTPSVVAGVPPDYFSATGQLWGNPLYRWDVLASTGYAWWIDRLRATLRLVDLVRLDHFRGFEAAWEIPAGATTAAAGRWVRGPGAGLFEALERALGGLPLLAENLGVITEDVEALRRRFALPGMAVLQFAFGTDPQAPTFRPHAHTRDLVVFTGTHDNDTTVGWWTSEGTSDSTRTPEDVAREKRYAARYLNTTGRKINWVMIRAALASVAALAIIPLQDVLGLGSEARMNRPACLEGNWRWRVRGNQLTPAIARRLRELTELYER